MQRSRQLVRLSILTAMLLALATTHADDKKKRQQYYLKPDQVADLHRPNLVAAKQDCINWGLAAGLETMLAQQKVALDQNFWVMRLNYGEICVNQLPSMEFLAKVVDNEFVLDDGRHVRLDLAFLPGAPTDLDSLIGRLQREQPSLLLWRGHPYYLVGATYDEHIAGNGGRMFEIKELRLADTLGKQRAVTFQKGRDDPAEIDGIVSVNVVQQ